MLEVEEVIDIAEYAKQGKKPPRAKLYQITVDKQSFRVPSPKLGKEILALVKKPPEKWNLQQKLKGGAREPIEPDQSVDFTKEGVERFETVPKEANNG